MKACSWVVLILSCLVAGVALAQAQAGAVVVEQPKQPGGAGWPSYYYYGRSQSPADFTIEELRKLGLSPEQIQKIVDLRRDIEKQRAVLEAQLQAANAEVARLHQEIRNLTTTRLVKAIESVMTPEQVKAWQQQEATEQAKQWLQGYRYWLKLTDAQVTDISALLAPVFAKYAKLEQDAADARNRLAELRRADKVDLAALEAAEKQVAELSTINVWQKRQAELIEKMRPGLLPDQLEKLDKIHGGQGGARF